MIFDFLFKKKKNVPADSQQESGKKKESIEERINREMASLPSFMKSKVSDPSIKHRFIELAKRMEKDGIDMNSPKAIKKWIKENEKKIKEEKNGKIEPVVKDHEPGRNDPCPCGSGKKYKKCCGK
jgi:uncharacterized protein YchJ